MKRIHPRKILSRSFDRPFGKDELPLAISFSPNKQTRPFPTICFPYKSRTKRISLDVPTKLEEMIVSFNGKRFVSSLVEMSVSDSFVVCVISLSVRMCQKTHKSREVFAFFGIENKMPMIWHNAKRKDPHGIPLFGFQKKIEKCFVVFLFFEDSFPAVRPVEDMIDGVVSGISRYSCHDGTVA